jgi:hypothetical protein
VNCCLCGSPDNVENAHPVERGMGGRGSKAPQLELVTFPLCARSGGNTDPSACHGAHHHGIIELEPTSDRHLRYRSTNVAKSPSYRNAVSALTKRGLRLDGLWHTALYEDADFDAIDAPREQVSR